MRFFASFSKHSVTGSPKWLAVSGAHPRGACSSWTADRGSYTGSNGRGKVCKVSVACNQLWIDWTLDCFLLSFDLLSAKGITGKHVTPFILQKVSALTKGKSLQASILLLKSEVKWNKGLDHVKFPETKNYQRILNFLGKQARCTIQACP